MTRIRRTWLVALAAALLAAVPARSGLVNYWSFNGNLSDTAASYRDSTSTSATSMMPYPAQAGSASLGYVLGPRAGMLALQTVGGANWGNVAITSSGLNGTADVAFAPDSTFAFWVKLPSGTVECFTDGNRFDHMKIISWGSGSVDVQIANAPGDATPLNFFVSIGEWHFVTITADRRVGLRRVYVDGELRASGVYNGSGTPVRKYLCLGVPNKTTYWGTVGFARMSLWDNAMSDSEVRCLYAHAGDVAFSCLDHGMVIIVR